MKECIAINRAPHKYIPEIRTVSMSGIPTVTRWSTGLSMTIFSENSSGSSAMVSRTMGMLNVDSIWLAKKLSRHILPIKSEGSETEQGVNYGWSGYMENHEQLIHITTLPWFSPSNSPTALPLFAMTIMEKSELRSPIATTVISACPSSSVVATNSWLNLTWAAGEYQKSKDCMKLYFISYLVEKEHIKPWQ